MQKGSKNACIREDGIIQTFLNQSDSEIGCSFVCASIIVFSAKTSFSHSLRSEFLGSYFSECPSTCFVPAAILF
jgi:hypothetical protein